MRLGSRDILVPVSVIPAGASRLTRRWRRWLPRGRVIEIYGPESGGKTTMTLHVIAEAQKLGGQAAFIDAEHRSIRSMRGSSAWTWTTFWSRSRITANRRWKSRKR